MIRIVWDTTDTHVQPEGGSTIDIQAGILYIDSVISMTIDKSVEVTEHPVENGSMISDHSIRLPLKITMECLVSNTPTFTTDDLSSYQELDLNPVRKRILEVGASPKDPARWGVETYKVGAWTLQHDREVNRAQEVYDTIMQLSDQAAIIDIENTPRGLLEDMVITQFSDAMNVDSSPLSAIQFTLALTHQRFVYLTEMQAPEPAVERARGRQNTGRDEGSEVPASQETSWWHDGMDFMNDISQNGFGPSVRRIIGE